MELAEATELATRAIAEARPLRATPVAFVPGIVTDVTELRQPCAKVKTVREGLRLANELRAVLVRNNKRVLQEFRRWDRKSEWRPTSVPGIGLSANQIGIQQRVCVIDNGTESFALVNPEIVKWSEVLFEYEEGCLSLPGDTFFTYRYAWVEIGADNWRGTRTFGCTVDQEEQLDAAKLLTVCFQHELGHLAGKLPKDFESHPYPAPPDWYEWRP